MALAKIEADILGCRGWYLMVEKTRSLTYLHPKESQLVMSGKLEGHECKAYDEAKRL